MSRSNEKIIRRILKEEGFSGAAIAGSLARFRAESNLNPTAKRKDDAGPGKDSIGILQWNRERLKNLQTYAARRGEDWKSTATQARFYAQEVKGKIGSEGKWGKKLLAAKTPTEAAEAAISLARPQGWSPKNPRGGHGWSKTNKWAREFFSGDVSDSPDPVKRASRADEILSTTANKVVKPFESKRITVDTAGQIRDKPLSGSFMEILDSVLSETGEGIGARITSGGQDQKGTKGAKRTGSERHDVDHTGHGHTGDLVLTQGGKDILPGQNKELYARFLRNAAPHFPGIGHYDWGVHVGGGDEASWGPDTTSATLDPIFGAAIKEGRAESAQREVSGMLRGSLGLGGESSSEQAESDPLFAAISQALGQSSGASDSAMPEAGLIDNSPGTVIKQIVTGLFSGFSDSGKKSKESSAPKINQSSMLRSEMRSGVQRSPGASSIEAMIEGLVS